MDIITYALAKGKSGGGGGVSQIQSDWNQNDETKVDYIKNKPLYKTEEGTVQIYDKKILNADGTIPIELFPNNVINDKFELWNDITLAEDAQLINISKTDDGKPLKIKKLFLYFYGKFNSKATLCLRYNNGQIYQSWKMVSASTKTDGFWTLSEKIAPGLYLSKYPENVIQVGDDGAAQGLGQHIQSIKSDFHYDAIGLVATSIIFGAHSSYPDFRMLTGSRILVWGVQDDD